MSDQNIADASGITQAPAADEGVQQIPAMIPVSAADDARDALLRAISAEARHVADKSTGQASPALEQLARAYALVTTGMSMTTNVASTAGRNLPLLGLGTSVGDPPTGITSDVWVTRP